jgi:hypothetical protein
MDQVSYYGGFMVGLIRGPFTTSKTNFGNGHRLSLVTGKAPVTDQVQRI